MEKQLKKVTELAERFVEAIENIAMAAGQCAEQLNEINRELAEHNFDERIRKS